MESPRWLRRNERVDDAAFVEAQLGLIDTDDSNSDNDRHLDNNPARNASLYASYTYIHIHLYVLRIVYGYFGDKIVSSYSSPSLSISCNSYRGLMSLCTFLERFLLRWVLIQSKLY